jgi:uncharacterized membrane protein YfcA
MVLAPGALVAAAGIGLALGLLGGGGSVLTVPVLVYIVGYDPKVAVTVSLGVVGAASLSSALAHWRAGRIDPYLAIPFGIITMAGSFVGARIGARLPGTVQLSMLAVVMLIAAASMLRDRPVGGTPAQARSHFQRAIELAPVGVLVGLLTGVIGIGGGFLLVPALVVWGGLAMPSAVGTSLLVIALNCVSGLMGYAGRVPVPWSDALAFIAVAIVFALIGSVFCGRIDARKLRHGFAIFLLAVGVFVLYRNRATFLHRSPGTVSGVTR